MELFQALFDIDWSGLIAGAVASGIGLMAATQLLKTEWVAVPARKYPRIVTAVLAVLVGIISTFAAGIELSSLTSFIVFVVVSFIVSGISYDGVRGLVGEVKKVEPVLTDDEPDIPKTVIDHVSLDSTETRVESAKVNSLGDRLTAEQVAQQIIDGVGYNGDGWGNGAKRRENLEAEGYDFDEVQSEVKKLLAKK